jgi:asparagine synthetase B (glutamine-hydrolysing)
MCGIALVLEARGACECASQSPSVPSIPSGNACTSSCASGGGLACALKPEIARRLRQRGPDHLGARHLSTPSGWDMALHSAVLHLRGPKMVAQPVEDTEGGVLCWNGEVFGGLERDEDADRALVLAESDTALLSARLERAGRALEETGVSVGDAVDPVVEVLRDLRGPFALVFVHRATQRVYFAHDRFGRRSLLYATCPAGKEGGDAEQTDVVAKVFAKSEVKGGGDCSVLFSREELARLVLSSVAVATAESGPLEFKEVPSTGVFVLDLRGRRSSSNETVFVAEFHPFDTIVVSTSPSQDGLPLLVKDVYDCGLPLSSGLLESPLDTAATALLAALSNAVGVRVRSIPSPESGGARVGVLFSGGLDSVVLAALTHFHLPAGEPVDLLTVCFDSGSCFQSPDRLAAQISHHELRRLFPSREWRLVRVDVPYAEVVSSEREVAALMAPCETHMDFNIGAAFWFLARARGEVANESRAAIAQTQAARGDGVSVDDLNAFLRPDAALSASYTLDESVAALHLFRNGQAATPVECPAANCKRKKKTTAICRFDVCRACCLKLQKLTDKLLRFRADRSSIDPREAAKSMVTVLAMGIESTERVDALLDVLQRAQVGEHDSEHASFGCRAHRMKQAKDDSDSEQVSATGSQPESEVPERSACVYESSSRVLLVGIGADEQLGGYGRHRTAFKAGGVDRLRAELAKDLGRIWKRNLGRDDRCISAHGREARFPFLDEQVVATIAQLPLESICDLELERGEGDKRVLRVAARQLGLESCTRLAKRAIQFGSRIAKHANARAFGSQRQAAGDAKFVVGGEDE